MLNGGGGTATEGCDLGEVKVLLRIARGRVTSARNPWDCDTREALTRKK